MHLVVPGLMPQAKGKGQYGSLKRKPPGILQGGGGGIADRLWHVFSWLCSGHEVHGGGQHRGMTSYAYLESFGWFP